MRADKFEASGTGDCSLCQPEYSKIGRIHGSAQDDRLSLWCELLRVESSMHLRQARISYSKCIVTSSGRVVTARREAVVKLYDLPESKSKVVILFRDRYQRHRQDSVAVAFSKIGDGGRGSSR